MSVGINIPAHGSFHRRSNLLYCMQAIQAFPSSFRHLMELRRFRKQQLKMYMGDLLTGLYTPPMDFIAR